MNTLEKERLVIADELVKNYNAKGYKASFEDEGASLEDISRAMIITEQAKLKLNIKVGGCEAIADIRQAKILGAKGIVAPMIETPYSLKKFISAIKGVYSTDEMEDLKLAINIETITGAENIKQIMEVAEESKILKRITIGRSDFIGSMNLQKSEINSDIVFEKVKQVFSIAKEHDFETAMGGGIDMNAIPFINKLGNLLDVYETRYIMFNNSQCPEKEMATGMMLAQRFEANYLQDMSDRYKNWSTTNLERCQMIKNRVESAEKYISNLK